MEIMQLLYAADQNICILTFGCNLPDLFMLYL